jgi:hypothetical protein
MTFYFLIWLVIESLDGTNHSPQSIYTWANYLENPTYEKLDRFLDTVK